MSKRIVVVGAGIAGLEALAVLHSREDAADAEVVVVAPETAFTVRALSVGEPFGLGHPHRYALADLVANLGGRLMRGRLREVLGDEHRIALEDDTTLPYDALLVAVGARAVPAFQHGICFDRETTPEDFDDALRDARRGLARSIAIVVAPETTWTLPAYELALLLRGFDGHAVPVTLVTHEAQPLEAFGTEVSRRVHEELVAAGVLWRHGAVTDVATDTTFRADGAWLQADRVVHLPVPVGPRIAGLPAQDGFVVAGAAGRVPVEGGRVWAAGDGTTAGRGSGAIAAQHAERAATDLLREVLGETFPEGPPLALCGLLRTTQGPLYLRADLEDPEGTSTWSNAPLWWPPSKVAAPWLTSALVAPAGPSGTRLQPTARASAAVL